MQSFCAVLMCSNNFKSDDDKSYCWLPAMVMRLRLLREKLSREKEKEGAVRQQTSGSQREFVYCLHFFTGIMVIGQSYLIEM